MTDPTTLAERVTQRLSSGEVELPVLDEVALRVYRESRAGELDAEGICNLMKRDAVLVGDVLRMANSSFFGGLVEVRNLRHAVVRLGTRQLAALALSAATRRLFSASSPPFRRRMRELWRHTAATAAGSGWLAGRAGHRALADEAYVAGLLHDMGKLLLLLAFEGIADADGVPPPDAEMDEVLRTRHTAHGARLLESWDLPQTFPALVRRLEVEPLDASDPVLCIVRLVDRACAREGVSDAPDPEIELEGLAEVAALGLDHGTVAELRRVLREDGGSAPAA